MLYPGNPSWRRGWHFGRGERQLSSAAKAFLCLPWVSSKAIRLHWPQLPVLESSLPIKRVDCIVAERGLGFFSNALQMILSNSGGRLSRSCDGCTGVAVRMVLKMTAGVGPSNAG